MVGDPIAFVVAGARHARDAAELVEADYDELPAVVDVEQAFAGGRRGVGQRPRQRGLPQGGGRQRGHRGGLPQRPPHGQPAHGQPAPGAQPDGDAGGDRPLGAGPQQLTVWSSSQIPHLLRTNLAPCWPCRHRVRVIVPEVGGGFGCKLNIYAEEALTAARAMLVNRPVKWIEDRRRFRRHHPRGRGVDYVDWRWTARGASGLRCKIIADLGSYAQVNTEVIPTSPTSSSPAATTSPPSTAS